MEFTTEVVPVAKCSMISQERACKQIPSDFYRGSVVEQVADQIDSEHWRGLHQGSVDLVSALLDTMGNNPDWKRTVLLEAAKDVRVQPDRELRWFFNETKKVRDHAYTDEKLRHLLVKCMDYATFL